MPYAASTASQIRPSRSRSLGILSIRPRRRSFCRLYLRAGNIGIESHGCIMHTAGSSPWRTEQRTEVDPHTGQVAHHGERGTGHAKKYGLSPRDELPATTLSRGNRSTHHQDNHQRLHGKSEGVVAERAPQVAVNELPSRPDAAAQRTPHSCPQHHTGPVENYSNIIARCILQYFKEISSIVI